MNDIVWWKVLIPRMNRVELLDRLKAGFPEQASFSRRMIEKILSANTTRDREKINFIFQSLSITEKRIFTIITSLIPLFTGNRGVILSTNWEELERIGKILGELFPQLRIQLVEPSRVQNQWEWTYKKGGDHPVSEEAFVDFNILLCAPHDFLRLKSDFKGITTGISAISFHNIIPSEWYYCEILALILKLSWHVQKCHFFYSSTTDLAHIRAIHAAKIDQTFELPTLRPDISWYNIVAPIRDWNIHDFYLRNSIKHFRALEPNSSLDISGAHALLLADETKQSLFRNIFSEENGPIFESLIPLSPHDDPEVLEEAEFIGKGEIDILLVEDILLAPALTSQDLESVLKPIFNALNYLKTGGKVIFFSPSWVNGTEELLSGLFPIKFNKHHTELMILFLLFHNCLREKELHAIFGSIVDKSLFRIGSRTVDVILNSLTKDLLAEEIHGRYSCTHRDKDDHRPDGRTIVRYKSFLEHKIQLYSDKKSKGKVKSRSSFKKLVMKARKLTQNFKFCPHILNFKELMRESFDYNWYNDFADEEDGFGKYNYAASNFSRINPAFQKYDPHKEEPEGSAENMAKSKKKMPHFRKKPVGQRYVKHRQYDPEFEIRLLQKLNSYVRETNLPIPWSDLISGIRIRRGDQVIKLSRSKGYRVVMELIARKVVKEVNLEGETNGIERRGRRLILRPKYFLEKDNRIGFRGRPLKSLVPYDFDMTLLKMNRCGDCHLFTQTKQCELIQDLLKIGKPESIPHLGIRTLILHKKVTPNLRIHPRMMGCDCFQKKRRDFELRSFPTTTLYDRDTTTGDVTEVEVYRCHIKECDGVMPYSSDLRTYKCPNCYTKYTWIRKPDGTEVISGNVDVHSTKNAVIRGKCGIIEEEEAEKRKRSMTKQYRKAMKKYTKNISSQKSTKIDKYDQVLRKNIELKYGTAPFYKRRMLAILLGYVLATLELKSLQRIDGWVIDRHVYAQLEQVRRGTTATTITQLRTAERVIANHYWQVCKRIFEQAGLPLSDRKLLRYVKEFLEQPFRGSKGYTPGNTLINNIHKICYENLRELMAKHGFGFECPGFAEHTNPRFGLVLDLSDLLKGAYRFTLIQAIIEGKITAESLYSIFGRHNQEIFLIKKAAFRKLEQLVESTNQKLIYPIVESTDRFYYKEKPLGEAIDQFIQQLADNLKFKDHLESAFVYAPNIDDYTFVSNILEDYQIPLPSVS